MQRPHGCYYACQRTWNRRFRGIGVMGLAVHDVLMDLGVKCLLHLRRRPAERDVVASARQVRHGETLRFQPICCGAEVGATKAKAIGELLWSEPAVIVGRTPVLLLSQQRVQGGLL